jgi:RNA polymerase sigma factor (sigma-70 family)
MDTEQAMAERREEQNQRLADAIGREESRLRGFIRKRVPDVRDAEEILQDVFYELILAYRLMKPIEEAGAWLFRVARNRITDFFRRGSHAEEAADSLDLDQLLPSSEAGPDAEFARSVLLGEIEAALAELPAEQREVFIAHELEGRRFKDLSAETGVGVNTLLARKHYAVVHLRKRLQAIYEEFREEW